MAKDLNGRGEVVGYSFTGDGRRAAFLWSRVTGMRELSGLSGSGAVALLVNDHGVVAGSATEADGTDRVVVWRGPRWRILRVGGRGDAVPIAEGSEPGIVDLTETGRLVGNSMAGVYIWDWARGTKVLASGTGRAPVPWT